MQPQVTFVTPIGLQHEALYRSRCLPSIEAQTIPVTRIAQLDAAGEGPAALRNAMLAQVQTPFVVFLDADDWVEPDFAEAALAAWQPGHYVYTDWFEDDRVKAAPAHPWCTDQQWHVITALIPTAAAQAVGFDPQLPGAEDTAFYWQLVRQGTCPLHLPRPLFHYGKEGTRSRAFLARPDWQQWVGRIVQQYGGYMGCCGGHDRATTSESLVANTPEPGDVLAVALWNGNRRERGRVTGRLYPRVGNGRAVWVAPADIAASPHLWRHYNAPPMPEQHGFDRLAETLFGAPTPHVQFAAPSDALVAPEPDEHLTAAARRQRAAQVLSRSMMSHG